MNDHEDQLVAIRAMLANPDQIVQMEGYDLLFNLWIGQENSKRFYNQLIHIALEHNRLLMEFESRINELVTRDAITDAHLRKLHRDLASEVAKARQESIEKGKLSKELERVLVVKSSDDGKRGDLLTVSDVDDSEFTKERWIFTIRSFFLPVGLNIVISALIYRFNGLFFEISWEPGYALIFLVSILFLNILLTDRAGQKDPLIANWIYFKKFHDFRNRISSVLAIIFLGILTNIVSDIIQGR